MPASNYSNTVLLDKAIRYYRQDESAGTVAYDWSSQAQNGTISGGVTLGTGGLLTGDPDTAMTFDGSTGYISIPTTGLPTGSAPFTLEIWVKTKGSLPSSTTAIMSFGTNATNEVATLFFSTSTNGFKIDLDGSVQAVGPAAAINTVYHIVGVYDGTNLLLYQNGTLVDGPHAATCNIVAGSAYIGRGVTGLAYWNNILDEAAIYNYALAASQVSNHYNAGANPGNYKISLAGQDITSFVDQMTVQVDDTLGQGSGAGSSGSTQGRASTIKFDTSLGPANTALGAGQTLPIGLPVLVRQGELIITDTTGTVIFGGYATKLTDTTTAKIGHTKQNFTAVEGIDYSTSLERIIINEVYTGASDVFIIRDIINKYASWVNLQYLPGNAAYTFDTKRFRNVSVEQALQTIAGITGFLVYVDYHKYLHYVSPTSASSAPFNLSDNPDFVLTFPHSVSEFLIDDNSLINKVHFYGGSKLSNDFWQDLSTLANGNNLVFPLAYYPSHQSDGKYHLKVNGTEQALGTVGGSGPANTYISQGGTAQALIDPGAKVITFDTGLAPASGATVLAGYRYNHPLVVVLTDENSKTKFGGYFDGVISDNTVFDLPTAVQRCKVLLSQQSLGLVTLKVEVYNKPGVQAGMLINVVNAVRGINQTYLVQEVATDPLGGGNFVYHLTLGAWNWNLIDFLLKLPGLSSFQDSTDNETTDTVTIQAVQSNVQVHDAWSFKQTVGPYYARSTPVGDGHDAYPGFATISS